MKQVLHSGNIVSNNDTRCLECEWADHKCPDDRYSDFHGSGVVKLDVTDQTFELSFQHWPAKLEHMSDLMDCDVDVVVRPNSDNHEERYTYSGKMNLYPDGDSYVIDLNVKRRFLSSWLMFDFL